MEEGNGYADAEQLRHDFDGCIWAGCLLAFALGGFICLVVLT